MPSSSPGSRSLGDPPVLARPLQYPYGTQGAARFLAPVSALWRRTVNFTAAPQSNRRQRLFARVLALAILAAAFMLLPAVTLADSNSAYSISGTLTNGSSFTGTIDFDTNTSTGVTTLVSSDFTVGGTSFSCDGASSNLCTVYDPFGTSFFQDLAGSALVVFTWSDFDFGAPPSSFAFTGGYCINCAAGSFALINGGEATQIPTPEPSTWLLLAAGLFALALISRRRSIAVPQS
jgi:hypothetical protein